jgi:hypothetical protein
VRLGCVVRVESIGQGPTMSLWGKSCPRGATWASLARGTYGGYMCEVDRVLFIPDGGAIEAQGVGYPLEKISCPVPLRTSMS